MKFEQFIRNYFPDLSLNLDEFEGFSLSVGLNINSDFIGPYKKNIELGKLLSWPPNVFMIAYSLLDFTDKYRLIVSPQDNMSWLESDLVEVSDILGDWKTLLKEYSDDLLNEQDIYNTPTLMMHLDNVFNKQTLNSSVYDLFDNASFVKSLFKLIISIDEIFSEVNVCTSGNNSISTILVARDILSIEKSNNLADNKNKYGIVTYKYCVPQTGLTLNNLTHNITVLKPSVKANIIANKLDIHSNRSDCYNILFLPWPKTIDDDSFKQSKRKNNVEMNPFFDFFDYVPKTEVSDKSFILAITEAIRRIGVIDLIVLPECALSNELFLSFKSHLFDCFGEKAPSLLSGVYGRDGDYSKNIASLAFIGEKESFERVDQYKHHRWFLDKNQLRNYNLSGSLDPNKKWWENIRINRRHLVSLHTKNGIRLCPLICEDLARQEPVAQAVRSVGPNLVISLLLDGPQIPVRWPGKYSAVLSDDPGSSVLSVSALGMTRRATGLGHKPSNDVALWSEPGRTPESLDVPDGFDGLILELKINNEKMWTMDGRCKDKVVLRKLMHTPVKIDATNEKNSGTVSVLKRYLKKELQKGSYYHANN
ncbi:hypothetical protein H3N34_10880 [Photobacterium damselae subsp. damselae]|uniref:hypothetical protein n=1 Tax=Photobacterium damselae TaxID=38293 RepID=UPI0015F4EF84|nr:hypothetical protein [Photobacterium damselae]MBA5683710.1 hypothetical protein [Photobacterium damselae subsp. damselae]